MIILELVSNKKKKVTRDLNEIGDIKDLRKDAKLTQEKVAKHCGVSVVAYQRWEHGIGKYIEEEKFNKLKEILGV